MVPPYDVRLGPVLSYDVKLGHQTRDVMSSKRKYNSINNSNNNQKENSKYNISWNSFCILRMINSWNNQKGTQYIKRNALLYLLVTLKKKIKNFIFEAQPKGDQILFIVGLLVTLLLLFIWIINRHAFFYFINKVLWWCGHE